MSETHLDAEGSTHTPQNPVSIIAKTPSPPLTPLIDSNNATIRPIYKKTSSSSSGTLKLANLPHLETSLPEYHASTQPVAQPRRVINVNESLLETVKNNGTSIYTPQPQSVVVPASILSGMSTPITPNMATPSSIVENSTPSTPLKPSASTISFQVQQQKHRGSISARPANAKVDSVSMGIVGSRQASNPMMGTMGASSSNHMITTGVVTNTVHSVSSPPPHTYFVTSPKSASTTGSMHTPNNISPGVVVNPITTTPMMNTPTTFSAANISRKENIRSPPSHFDLSNSGSNIHSSPKYHINDDLGLYFDSTPSTRKSSIQFQPLELNRVNSTNSVSALSSTSTSSKKKTTKTLVTPPVGPIVPFTQYLSKEDDDKIHILIGATGSVATIKILMIVDKLFKIYGTDKVSIQLVVTRAAEHFLRGMKISTEVKIWREQEEWSAPMNKIKPGDPILHVELRKWADILLIAPLSANTLAKIANGLADNLLTSIVRVWNPAVPILVAPAMNTFMYKNPMTKIHLDVLREDFKFIEVLKPIEKVLVCGDIGMGGMREWSDVVDVAVKKLKEIMKVKKAEKEQERKVLKEKEMLEENERIGEAGERGGDEEDDEDEEDEEDDEDEEEDEEDDDDDDDEDDDDDDDEDDDEDEEKLYDEVPV